jgi:hypothetical protein
MANKSNRYAAIFMFSMTPAWIALTPEQRVAWRNERLVPIFMKHREKVRVRLFDTAAFSNECSDFMFFESEDLESYRALVWDLRNTELLSKPYLIPRGTLLAVEDDFV